MAIAHVQSLNTTGTSATPNLGFSVAPAAGNLLVAFISTILAGSISATPTGWTNLTVASAGTGGSQRGGFLSYKVADGTEGTGAFSWTWSGSNVWMICIAEYSGTHPTTPLDTGIENSQANASGTETTPTVTPSASGVMGLAGISVRSNTNVITTHDFTGADTVNARQNLTTNASINGTLFDIINITPSGSYSASAAFATNGVGVGAIAFFKAAAAASSIRYRAII